MLRLRDPRDAVTILEDRATARGGFYNTRAPTASDLRSVRVGVGGRVAVQIGPHISWLRPVAVQPTAMIRIGDAVRLGSGADDKNFGRPVGLVDQRMTGRIPRPEGRCIAPLQHRLRLSLEDGHFTIEHEDKFILLGMPVL